MLDGVRSPNDVRLHAAADLRQTADQFITETSRSVRLTRGRLGARPSHDVGEAGRARREPSSVREKGSIGALEDMPDGPAPYAGDLTAASRFDPCAAKYCSNTAYPAAMCAMAKLDAEGHCVQTI